MSSGEIGGYFGLSSMPFRPYHEKAILLNSARNCLAYLIMLREIKSIAIPDYMCDAVEEICKRMKVRVRRYKVVEDFTPCFEFCLDSHEWLYLADYFGQLTDDQVWRAFDFSGGRLIVDEVQGFFREPWSVADTIYTCRKYFAVPDGAYLVTKDGKSISEELPIDSSCNRLGFLFGRLEYDASSFYEEYRHNESYIENDSLKFMSQSTRLLLSVVDYASAKVKREDNWRALDALLSDGNCLQLEMPAGPFMYPYCTSRAKEIRHRLIENRVYVPTLWPNVLKECSEKSIAYCYSNNILPLPIDQRYDAEDMEFIGSLISKA